MIFKITKDIRSRLFFGFAIPILAEVIAAILIINAKSGAYAEGFAYIPVFVILIIALPVTLAGNEMIVPPRANDNRSYLFRGMILPACFIGVVLMYYTGLWDHTIRPYFPKHVEKIQTAGGGRGTDNTYESFFTVNNYTHSSEDQDEIENYARETFTKNTFSSEYITLNVMYYFVPSELYDPFDDSLNRERAVAVFRHMGIDGGATIEKVER